MSEYLKEFTRLLADGDRYGCVKMALSLLESGKTDIPGLYTGIVAPAFGAVTCEDEGGKLCIWKEHVRTAIVRSVIENVYTYVEEAAREKRPGSPKSVAVVCPDGEYHELGARMAADFFALCGFEVTFVGSSTPPEEFVDVVGLIRPDFIAVSVTNFYNLVSAKRTIDAVKARYENDVRVIAGGRAFLKTPDIYRETGADYCLQTYEDICAFASEVMS